MRIAPALTVMTMVIAVSSLEGCAAGATSSQSAGSGQATGPVVSEPLIGAASSTTSSGTAGSPAPGPTCDPVGITIRQGTRPQPVCLPTGTDLRLSSEAATHQPWSVLHSSDEAVLTCRSTTHPDGSISALCHALAPGRATLTTTTAPFAGDRHGPPQYQWQLVVTVQPS